MTYATFSIDRRAEYYARCAELIAADPLWFYTRAEKGRRILANWQVPRPAAESPALPCEANGGGVVVPIRKRRA